MRVMLVAGILILALMFSLGNGQARSAITNPGAAAKGKPEARIASKSKVSGVYGFSGARVADGSPRGVIGECVWIFDASDKTQVTKGDCDEANPGKFQVPLTPGHYVVHGPGGTKAIEVKKGHWIKVISVVALPRSF
jgi:hypothetical protein